MHRRTNVPLNALRAFEAAARAGRLTIAGVELGVTHGAVSRQVKQLEALLGVELIAGSRARPQLTEEGRFLLGVLTPTLDRIDDAVRALKVETNGVLQVGCLSSFAVRWLIPRLYRFAAAHPGVEVRLATTADTRQNEHGGLDLAITIADEDEPDRPSDNVLFHEWIGIVVAPRLLDAGNAPISPLRRLRARSRPDAWRQWERLAAARPRFPTQGSQVQFEHYHFAIQAAVSGLGACVAPWHLVADDLAECRLAAPMPFVKTGNRYVLRKPVTAKLVRPKAATQRHGEHFASWLQQELVATQGLLNIKRSK